MPDWNSMFYRKANANHAAIILANSVRVMSFRMTSVKKSENNIFTRQLLASLSII